MRVVLRVVILLLLVGVLHVLHRRGRGFDGNELDLAAVLVDVDGLRRERSRWRYVVLVLLVVVGCAGLGFDVVVWDPGLGFDVLHGGRLAVGGLSVMMGRLFFVHDAVARWGARRWGRSRGGVGQCWRGVGVSVLGVGGWCRGRGGVCLRRSSVRSSRCGVGGSRLGMGSVSVLSVMLGIAVQSRLEVLSSMVNRSRSRGQGWLGRVLVTTS